MKDNHSALVIKTIKRQKLCCDSFVAGPIHAPTHQGTCRLDPGRVELQMRMDYGEKNSDRNKDDIVSQCHIDA